MALTNADVTSVIEKLTVDFRVMLENLNTTSMRNHNYRIEPTVVIDQLLYHSNQANNIPLTVSQLNQNYRTIMALSSNEELIKKDTNLSNNSTIMQSAVIHLTAIAAGFKAYADEQQLKLQQENMSRAAKPKQVHIHHHHGYRRDYFMDYLWYQTLFGRDIYSPSYPAQPTTKPNKKDENKVSTAGILLAVALVGSATTTLGYSIMQTYYRIEEILHNEDKLANIGKLTITAFAAWQGFLVGSLIGATYFANPLLGAVCTSIIASAAGMKLGKWSMELAHSSSKSDSALDYDPRFILSNSEYLKLADKGFAPNSVNEAIREVASMIKAQSANGLKFWHNPHGPLIDLMRELKSGYQYERLVINGKAFELMAPQNAYENIEVTQPSAYEYTYEPNIFATPQVGAGYPQWQEQQAVPENYQCIYPQPSAPPFY